MAEGRIVTRQNSDDRISRKLSFVLRHKPDAIGLVLDAEGWASTDELVEKLRVLGTTLTLDDLYRVVRTSDKKRFILSNDGTMVRAAQGHSIPVDLGLRARIAPQALFHGTRPEVIDSIFSEGLMPRQRVYVHLSADIDTARSVGERRTAEAVVLRVDARQMQSDGYEFYQAENGVWLAKHVPPQYISVVKSAG